MQLLLIEKNVKTINKTTITQSARNQSAPFPDWPIEGAGLDWRFIPKLQCQLPTFSQAFKTREKMRESSSVQWWEVLKSVIFTFLIFLHVVRLRRVLDAHGLYLVSEDHVVSLVVAAGHRDVNAVWSGECCCQHGVTWTIELRHYWLLAVSLWPTLESWQTAGPAGQGCALQLDSASLRWSASQSLHSSACLTVTIANHLGLAL